MVALVFFAWTAPARAIGVSPSKLSYPEILPQTTIEDSFQFLRGGFEGVREFTVTVEGTGAPFITLQEEKIIFSDDWALAQPVHFTLSPKAATPGDYRATVTILPAPPTSETADIDENGIAIDSDFLVGIAAKIDFSVIRETREEAEGVSIQLERLQNDDANAIAVRPRMMIKNTGNVPIFLDHVMLMGSDAFAARLNIDPPVTLQPYDVRDVYAESVTLPASLQPPVTVSVPFGADQEIRYTDVTWPGAGQDTQPSVPWWRKILNWFAKFFKTT